MNTTDKTTTASARPENVREAADDKYLADSCGKINAPNPVSEQRLTLSNGAPMNEASQKASDEAWAFSHQGRSHAANIKRRAKREAAKAKRRAEYAEVGYKGSDKRFIPAEKPTAIKTQDDWLDAYVRLERERNEAQAQAAQLAEALQNVLLAVECEPRNKDGEHNIAAAFNEAREALAAYEAAR